MNDPSPDGPELPKASLGFGASRCLRTDVGNVLVYCRDSRSVRIFARELALDTIRGSRFHRASPTGVRKHELLDGEILAFSGGSFDHYDISLNVCKLLDDRVVPPCKAHNSDTIIETRASKGESGLRADASVSCSSTDAGKAEYMQQPRIIVEFRSPSNVGEKRENKLFEYRDTHSIEQIVIIESETRSVRSYVRDEEWQWRQKPTLVGAGVLAFRVGVNLTLDERARYGCCKGALVELYLAPSPLHPHRSGLGAFKGGCRALTQSWLLWDVQLGKYRAYGERQARDAGG